jgi:thiol-disulfide isomerase/thioredoxin
VVGLVVAIGIAAIVAAVAAGGGHDKTTTTDASGRKLIEYGKVTTSGKALTKFESSQPAVGDGEPLPTITGQSPTGTPVTVAPGNGPQVVIVGAPWCPHCNNELPPLARALRSGELGNPRVSLVVTSQQPDAPHWPPGEWVVDTLDWPTDRAPVVFDDKNMTAATTLGTPAYPYFIFVDSQGRVGSRITGEIGLDTFRSRLQQLR